MQTKGFFSVISLGCSKNLVDTEILCGQMSVDGYVLSDDPSISRILIINTCGFLGSARDEADEEIRQALIWRSEVPGRRVIVGGCYPQKNAADFVKKFPEVDIILGVDDIPNICQLIRAADERQEVIHGEGLQNKSPRYLYDHTTPRLPLTLPHYAYVKIADGCNHGCRYCSIPLIRGRQRSRTIASVVEECKALLANGVRELNLVAQDTSRYGEDLGDGTNLVKLLNELDALKGKFWIRLLYFHPKYVSEDLLQAMASYKHVVPYIDLPLQHISNRILEAMGRRMGGEETRTLMNRIREILPNACVRTTFIVGFPGETEEDFEELLDYVKTYQFDRLGVFVYSPEPGTPAAKISEGKVPLEVAEQRRDQLMQAQQEVSLKKNAALVGKRLDVLIDQVYSQKEGKRYVNVAAARTIWDAPEVDNQVNFVLTGKYQEGDWVTVRVVEADAYDLFGEICVGKGNR